MISDALPPEEQSLAGAVFNQVAQFGNSFGLAITAVIAATVREHSAATRQKEQLMEGFRAAFWTIFASTGLVIIISLIGFKGAGFVGQKDAVDKNDTRTSKENLT